MFTDECRFNLYVSDGRLLYGENEMNAIRKNAWMLLGEVELQFK